MKEMQTNQDLLYLILTNWRLFPRKLTAFWDEGTTNLLAGFLSIFSVFYLANFYPVNHSSEIYMKPRPLERQEQRNGWHSQVDTLTIVIMFKNSFAKQIPKFEFLWKMAAHFPKQMENQSTGVFSILKPLPQLCICQFYPFLYILESIFTPPVCMSPRFDLVSCLHRECFSRTVHIVTAFCSLGSASKSIFIRYKKK